MSEYEFTRSLAVIIGINNYSNGIDPLTSAVNDAKELGRILREEYKYNEVILITDDPNSEIQPTQSELIDFLDITLLEKNLTESDRLLFYFAGHGIARPSEDGPQGFLVPSDASAKDAKSLISMKVIYESLAKLQCRHLLVILDCCFAGAFRWVTRKAIYDPEKITKAHYDRFTRFPAWQVITSSAHNQEALDFLDNRGKAHNKDKHSPFALALFEGLQGKADIVPDGVITAPELYIHLSNDVAKNTQERQTPGFFPLVKHDRGEFIFLLPNFDRKNLDDAPKLNPENNPYRGLKAYEEEHARFFFGRQELIQRLFLQLSRPKRNFTVVLGISGSGKSSLVQAGLIPQLRQEQQQDNIISAGLLTESILQVVPSFPLKYWLINYNYQWQILETMRPGIAPFKELVRIFTPLVTNDISAEEVKNNPQKLIHLINQWSKNNPQHKILLVIDQFEELITQAPKVVSKEEDKKENWLDKIKNKLFGKQKETTSESEEVQPEWHQFLDLLVNIIQNCPQLSIVVTLRSDFEPRFAESVLKPYWNRFIVRPMRPDELREVVEAPATEMALYFEPANLVDRLVDEVNQMPGALPLLSFTLSELYVKLYEEWKGGIKSDRCLTVDAEFEKQGGVAGSLTSRANEVYLGLPDDAHRVTMRRVILRMVEIEGGEAVRRRVLKSEITYPNLEENERVETVLKCLDTARLIVTGKDTESGESYYEPAHDFLVRGWDKLQDWIKYERENLTLQRLVTPAAKAWNNRGNKVGDLWVNNSRLDRFKEIYFSENNWQNQLESQFVEKSFRRRRFNLISLISVITVVIVILSSISFIAWNEQKKAKRNEKEAFARSLAAQAKVFKQQPHLLYRSMLLAIQAYKNSPDTQILDVGEVLSGGLALLGRSFDENIIISSDSRYQAKIEQNNTITISEISTNKIIKQISISNRDYIKLALSAEGKYLAIHQNNKLMIIEVENEKLIFLHRAHSDWSIFSIHFDMKNKYVALLKSYDGDDRFKNKALEVYNFLLNKEILTNQYNKENEYLLSVSFLDNNSMRLIKCINLSECRGNSENKEQEPKIIAEDIFLNSTSLQNSSKEQNIAWRINYKKDIEPIINNNRYLDFFERIAFSKDRKYMAIYVSNVRISSFTGYETVMSVWNIEKQKEVAIVLDSRVHGTNNFYFSSDSKYISTEDELSQLTPFYNNFEIPNIINLLNQNLSIALTKNESFLVSFYDEKQNKYKVLKLNDRSQEKSELNISNNPVNISPNGKYIAVYNSKKSIVKISKILSNSVSFIRDINLDSSQDEPEPEIIFSSDEQYLAINRLYRNEGYDTSKTNLWKIETGNPVVQKQKNEKISAYKGFRLLALSPGGKFLATATHGFSSPNVLDISYISIRNITTGKSATQIIQNNLVSNITYSPDGNYLATSSDKTVLIWELATGKKVARMEQESVIQKIFFSVDTKHLFLLTEDGVIRKQLWQPTDLVENSCKKLTRNMTWREWNDYMGNRPYEKTCHELPIHSSVIQEAMTRAVFNKDIDGAVEIFNRVLEIDGCNADLNPATDELEQDSKALAEQLIDQGGYQPW